MNRIILIGNGFDLAHGLKTSYKHFIDYYWENLSDELQSEKGKYMVYNDDFIHLYKKFSYYYGLPSRKETSYEHLKDAFKNTSVKLTFENLFFKTYL